MIPKKNSNAIHDKEDLQSKEDFKKSPLNGNSDQNNDIKNAILKNSSLDDVDLSSQVTKLQKINDSNFKNHNKDPVVKKNLSEKAKEAYERKLDAKKMREIKKINANFKQKKCFLARKYGKQVLKGKVVSLSGYNPIPNKYIIELNNVHKWYYTGSVAFEALKGINFKIKSGSFVCILGPSGSGKTTLLNIVSGLDTAEEGDIFVNGCNLSILNDRYLTQFRRNNVSFIFQQYNLLANLTAYENAEVGANLAAEKVKKDEIKKIFTTIGLKNEMHKFPFQLSGGQQQRVSIARALAKNPKILFCDEPTGALDEKTGKVVLDVLLKINKEFGTTIVFVTHNPHITKISDIVIKFHDGGLDSFIENENPATSAKSIIWA